jgi:uncharacterized protein DUF3850
MSRYYDLKTWPAPFTAIRAGQKRHEVRKTDDRTFLVGDNVTLREWDPLVKGYTGRSEAVTITYVSVPGSWGLPDNVAVFSFRRLADIGAPDA